jgi:hypothetical protein
MMPLQFEPMKTPRLKRDYIGKYIELIVDLENALCHMPAGTICRITRYSAGKARIKGETCPTCKVQPIMLAPLGTFRFVKHISEKSTQNNDG